MRKILLSKLFLSITALLCFSATFGQNTLKIKVIQADTKEPIWGVSAYIQSMENGTVTDSSGIAYLLLGNVTGNYKLIVSHVSFEGRSIEITIPHPEAILEITLEPKEKEEEEVF